MRQLFTRFLFLSSLCGFAQLYVAEDAVFSIPSSESTFSSQESINNINSSVTGQGTLYFNAEVLQYLSSSETVLQLPNLRIKNADLVTIHTDLEVQQSLIIDSGTLTLSEDLYLQDATALQTQGDGAVVPTPTGQLIYKSQRSITNHTPGAICDSITFLSFVTPSTLSIEFIEWPVRTLSNFESFAFHYHTPYMPLSTPPPKHIALA